MPQSRNGGNTTAGPGGAGFIKNCNNYIIVITIVNKQIDKK